MYTGRMPRIAVWTGRQWTTMTLIVAVVAVTVLMFAYMPAVG